MAKIAIYPGTFDPMTNGHIDIVKRSLKIVDKLIISVANNVNKPIYVDPKSSNFISFKNVRLFKPNLVEFCEGFESNQNSIKNDGFQLKKELNADMILITQGSDGASLFENSEYHHIPT